MIPRLARLLVAHKAKAAIQMQEHMELAALVDKLEALEEADAKQQYTHRWTDAINAKGRWGQWENIDIVLLDGIAKPTERLDGWQPASLISQIQSSSCPPECFDQLQSNEGKKGCTEMPAENRPYDWASETPARQKANRHTKTPYLGGRKRCRHSPPPKSQPPHRDPSTSKRSGRKVVSSIGTIAIILLAATAMLKPLGPTEPNLVGCPIFAALSTEEGQKDTQKNNGETIKAWRALTHILNSDSEEQEAEFFMIAQLAKISINIGKDLEYKDLNIESMELLVHIDKHPDLKKSYTRCSLTKNGENMYIWLVIPEIFRLLVALVVIYLNYRISMEKLAVQERLCKQQKQLELLQTLINSMSSAAKEKSVDTLAKQLMENMEMRSRE